ncbi:type II toxin-antitoxin system VapC family toxin [Roseofilum casamattae]|uniref:Type II toxin-antitoxin system VapC family toxin n=1 Tax=Roseofilum casamattae BLCC-M143 TaxID=3022442 RepID=A0ABT7BWK2_9CYAN|nr:type II toxin-antitoxin system VapC family toxin [Roseofilum casamattae]MDJ1183455.1 type II toxin-antitoxin system VapC family toxin [Roseofilum casamattae BLCC-M143]
MPFLLDTNILLRIIDREHPMNADAMNAIAVLRRRGEPMYIVPQNLIECWNVCTRPREKNGLGRTVAQAEAEINRLKKLFPLLSDPETIYQEWEQLVVTYKVMGANVHDARLVAAMLVHGLTHILTFNVRDFTRYREIAPVDPTTLTS